MSEFAALEKQNRDPVVAFVGTEGPPRWNMRMVAMATLIAVGIGLGFLLLYRFYMIVFLFFVSFSIATAVKPIASRLQKRGISPLFGILPIYLGSVGLIIGLLWLIGPLIAQQFVGVVQALPEYYHSLRLYLQHSASDLLQAASDFLPPRLILPLSQLSATATTENSDPIGLLGDLVSNTGKTIFMVIGVLLLAYYWLVEGDMIMRRLVLRTRLERREQLRELISEIEDKIGGYFRGQLLLCLIIGVLSLIAFLIIGVPNALTLALICGVTEAIPILGPTLGAVPALLMTLSTEPIKAIWVLLAMVLIQSMENNLLVPRIMGQSVGVNPLLTLLSIAAFGLLFGFVGAILAIPLAAILQILLNRQLFSPPTVAEVTVQPDAGAQPTRSRMAVLRLEAQELAQDVRKQARSTTEQQGLDTQMEQAEDMIETVASNLESYLVQQERPQ